jgi:ubiquitin related modifier 1
MNVVLEFSGGAELLVGKLRKHQVALPLSDPKNCWNIGALLLWIKENLLKERPELFLKDPSAKKLDVRPGILVLVNDVDWELMGQTDYALEVSTEPYHIASKD